MDSAGHVVLGVTGSIAAFKAAQLASKLVQDNLETRVLLTRGAAQFIKPLTFEAITGHEVGTEVWDERPEASRMDHLELARWADVLVVAPASADAIARLSLGLADDLLTTTALASRAPLLLAPAMESAMWNHPATQSHVENLRARGASIIGPTGGHLASGATGQGRMAEPEDILAGIWAVLRKRSDLANRRVMVTAGPTFEPIDPVRFIGNRSSGKMGYAVAEEARDRGADVLLISGPTSLLPVSGVEMVEVETAEQMHAAVLTSAASVDVIVMAAAVADFRAGSRAEKIKRRDALTLELMPTPDIAADASAAAPNAIHVGFALETRDLLDSAREKLAKKGQDIVVANLITSTRQPFGSETNQVAFVTSTGVVELPLLPKREVARRLWDLVAQLLAPRTDAESNSAESTP